MDDIWLAHPVPDGRTANEWPGPSVRPSRLPTAPERLVRCVARCGVGRRGTFEREVESALGIARKAAQMVAGHGGEIAYLTAHLSGPGRTRYRSLVGALSRAFAEGSAPLCTIVPLKPDLEDPGLSIEIEVFVRPARDAALAGRAKAAALGSLRAA